MRTPPTRPGLGSVSYYNGYHDGRGGISFCRSGIKAAGLFRTQGSGT